jgi:hypothetical protein
MAQERILDLEISPLDFVDLSGRDAVAALFSLLGYDTNGGLRRRPRTWGWGRKPSSGPSVPSN